MERLAAFEAMLSEIKTQSDYETAQMEKLKAEGKEKSATYRQYFGNRLLYKNMLELYRKYQLIDEKDRRMVQMGVVLGLGIFWTLYGIAGMLGFQVINEKYKNHAWTTEYIHSCGISWFILGVPELILYLLVCGRGVNTLVVSLLILLCGVPSIVYTVIKDQKYKHMLKEQ